MSIQDKIDQVLEKAIKEKDAKRFIDNIKFLKAETQRGKMKVMEDKDVINIFVSLIRKQNDMRDKLAYTSKEYQDSCYFVNDICFFLNSDIVDQINIRDIQIIDWIEKNVDMSNVKNPNMLIGIVKKAFPYIDGNLIKDSIKLMGEPV
ncbi:hypothetical protein M0R04_05040 [Candidatus Dojkabacteria bacterium]|jgi:hypothetical protein|nr:hypothetical protein [Candidatus Dojkabacteria bacterium]